MTSIPVPSTAMVEPAPCRPPRCAAASMPSASPETMVKPGFAQRTGESLGVGGSLLRGVAAADDGERGALQQLCAAARVEQRRRIGDFEQQPGIGLVGEGDDRMARLAPPRRARAPPPSPPAPSRARRALPPARARTSSERLRASTACGRPNCCSSLRSVAGPSPGVSESCSQLASPGSWLTSCSSYGVCTTSSAATGLVTCMMSA